MRTYELVLVYDPRVADDEVMSLSGEVRNLLTAKGGVTITKTDVWGRRRLAYEIEDVNEGKYVVIYFAAEDGKAPIGEVERRLQQNDRVLRFLTTRTDEGLKRAGLPIPLEPESEDAVLGIVKPVVTEGAPEGGAEPAERPARSPRRRPAAEESEGGSGDEEEEEA